MRARAPSTLDFHHGLLVAREAPAAKQGDYPALLTSKWVEVQVGATRSYAIWAVTA